MAKTITIALSDELFNDLKKYKKNINVSKVCQDAIKTEVSIQKMKEDVPNFELLIRRIREERKRDEKYYKEIGFKEGMDEALKLSYQEFKKISSDYYEYKDAEDGDGPIEELLFEDYTKNKKKLDKLTSDATVEYYSYCDGWVQGVLHIWEKVKNTLISNQENVK